MSLSGLRVGNQEDLNGPGRLKQIGGPGKSRENRTQREGFRSFWLNNTPSWDVRQKPRTPGCAHWLPYKRKTQQGSLHTQGFYRKKKEKKESSPPQPVQLIHLLQLSITFPHHDSAPVVSICLKWAAPWSQQPRLCREAKDKISGKAEARC